MPLRNGTALMGGHIAAAQVVAMARRSWDSACWERQRAFSAAFLIVAFCLDVFRPVLPGFALYQIGAVQVLDKLVPMLTDSLSPAAQGSLLAPDTDGQVAVGLGKVPGIADYAMVEEPQVALPVFEGVGKLRLKSYNQTLPGTLHSGDFPLPGGHRTSGSPGAHYIAAGKPVVDQKTGLGMNFLLLSVRLFGHLQAAVYSFNLVNLVLIQLGTRALQHPVVKFNPPESILAGRNFQGKALDSKVQGPVLTQASGVFRGLYPQAPKKAGGYPAGAELVPGKFGFIENCHLVARPGQFSGAARPGRAGPDYYHIPMNLRVVLTHRILLRKVYMGRPTLLS